MSDDPNRVVVSTTAPTEAQGVMIVAALEAQDVQAQTTGTLISSRPMVLQVIKKESG